MLTMPYVRDQSDSILFQTTSKKVTHKTSSLELKCFFSIWMDGRTDTMRENNDHLY